MGAFVFAGILRVNFDLAEAKFCCQVNKRKYMGLVGQGLGQGLGQGMKRDSVRLSRITFKVAGNQKLGEWKGKTLNILQVNGKCL